MSLSDFDARKIADFTRELATGKYANTRAELAQEAKREAWLQVADEAAALYVEPDDGDFDEYIGEAGEVFDEAWSEHFKITADEHCE